MNGQDRSFRCFEPTPGSAFGELMFVEAATAVLNAFWKAIPPISEFTMHVFAARISGILQRLKLLYRILLQNHQFCDYLRGNCILRGQE